MDFEFLEKNGQEQATDKLQKRIGETKYDLLHTLNLLKTTGKTALGPAVLTSIALASAGKQGSTVVVCTDGLSNIGLGCFD